MEPVGQARVEHERPAFAGTRAVAAARTANASVATFAVAVMHCARDEAQEHGQHRHDMT